MTPTGSDGAMQFPQPVDPTPKPVADTAQLYAALDLGTNSCRMLIAQPKGTQFHVVDSFSKSVQLGRGLERHGTLSKASVARTIQALRICQRKLEDHNVARMRLVATEACRRARNSGDFIARVRGETGLDLEIIRPEEEARLAVVSCAPLVSRHTEQLLVVDIGGGSTELVWIDLSRVAPSDRARAIMRMRAGFEGANAASPFPVAQVVDWISVPCGVATLKDLFDDVGDENARFALMSCHFEEQIAGFAPYQDADGAAPREGFQIIGTSGTVTTVAGIHLDLPRYDRRRVDGLWMSADQADDAIDRLRAMDYHQRAANGCIGHVFMPVSSW